MLAAASKMRTRNSPHVCNFVLWTSDILRKIQSLFLKGLTFEIHNFNSKLPYFPTPFMYWNRYTLWQGLKWVLVHWGEENIFHCKDLSFAPSNQSTCQENSCKDTLRWATAASFSIPHDSEITVFVHHPFQWYVQSTADRVREYLNEDPKKTKYSIVPACPSDKPVLRWRWVRSIGGRLLTGKVCG